MTYSCFTKGTILLIFIFSIFKTKHCFIYELHQFTVSFLYFFILHCIHMSKFNHLYGPLDCFWYFVTIFDALTYNFVYVILYIEGSFSIQASRSGTAALKGKFIVHFIMGKLCFAPKWYKLHPFMKWVRVWTLHFWKK